MYSSFIKLLVFFISNTVKATITAAVGELFFFEDAGDGG